MTTFTVSIYDHPALTSTVRVEVSDEIGNGLHLDLEKDGDKPYGHVVGHLIDELIAGMES